MGQVKKSPAGERLSDRIAIGVLTRVFPPGLVDEAITQTGRAEQRSRLLPARVVVYFVLAMCLFFGQRYEEVARLLGQGLGEGRSWRVPTTAAIGRACRKLGPEPLRLLFERVPPVAVPATAGVWYRRWHLVTVDGTTLDLADTPDNDAFSAIPAPGAGQVRSRRSGWWDWPNAAPTPCSVPRWDRCRRASRGCHGSCSPIFVRGCCCWPTGASTTSSCGSRRGLTGADLLWRVRKSANLPVVQVLGDGSYLSTVHAEPDRRTRRNPVVVRVVEYTLARTGHHPVYRLITTLLEPTQAPTAELAGLYAQRWEIETVLNEIKTHQRGPKLVLPFKYLWGVEQEVYGLLLDHHAIRQLMHQAALHEGVDPDRLSFTRSLRVVRRQVPAQAALSPGTEH